MRQLWRDRYRSWLLIRPVWPRLLHRRGRHHQRHDSVDHHGSSNVGHATDSSCTYVSHHLWAPGMCEHYPNPAERSEQCVQSASSSTFQPAICLDNPFQKVLALNWQLGSEHYEDKASITAETQRRDAWRKQTEKVESWEERNRKLYGLLITAMPPWLRTSIFNSHSGDGMAAITYLQSTFDAGAHWAKPHLASSR